MLNHEISTDSLKLSEKLGFKLETNQWGGWLDRKDKSIWWFFANRLTDNPVVKWRCGIKVYETEQSLADLREQKGTVYGRNLNSFTYDRENYRDYDSLEDALKAEA